MCPWHHDPLPATSSRARECFLSGRLGERSPRRTTVRPPVHFPAIGVCAESVLPRPGRGHTWLLKSRYQGPLQRRLGTPISHAQGVGGSRQSEGDRGALRVSRVPRSSAVPLTSLPPVPANPLQDPPAASGPPPRAPRSGTAAARTRSGWFSPPPPPARGGSRRRRGYRGPPARAAARAPGAAGCPRPSPAEPPGHPPRAGSCPAGSPGSKSWSAGLPLQTRTPCRQHHAGRAEVKCGDVRGKRH